MTTFAELGTAAGRAARDGAKRRVALLGVLGSVPALLLGGLVARLPAPDPGGLARPLAWVLDPLRAAWWRDDDAALLGYLGLQALLLLAVWGLAGGTLARLAAVEVADGRREDVGAAFRFARRRWRTFVGAKAALAVGVLVPLLVAALLALGGRLPGVAGGLLAAVGVVAALVLAGVAVLVLGVALTAGCLTAPVTACEGPGLFDAVVRPFTYAGAGLPRLVGLRLRLLGGVLLGSLWRALGTLAAAGLGLAAVTAGAGAERLARARAVLGAMGTPADAARLGIDAGDRVLAVALALAGAALLARWLADLAVRVACARAALYLLLRERVDGVPRATLAEAPSRPGHRGPEAAGFVEVGRVGPG